MTLDELVSADLGLTVGAEFVAEVWETSAWVVSTPGSSVAISPSPPSTLAASCAGQLDQSSSPSVSTSTT